jgi:hypothetical protein
MGQRASLSLLLIKTDQENPAHDGVGRKEFEAEGTSNNTSGLSFRLQASGDIGDASSSNLSEIDEFDEVIKEARSLEELVSCLDFLAMALAKFHSHLMIKMPRKTYTRKTKMELKVQTTNTPQTRLGLRRLR